MKKLLVTALLGIWLGLWADPAQAFGRRRCRDDCCPPSCDVTVTYVDKVVTCFKPVWRTEKVKCVVNKIYCREEIIPVKCTVMVPRLVDVKKTCTFYVQVPRLVERDVLCCKYVPAQCTDPCTGCSYTCCKTESYVKKVKCTVYECREETRDVLVKVCHYEPQVREYKIRRFIRECRPEAVLVDRHYCEMVSHQVKIKVPVCVPCSSTVLQMPYAE